VSVGAVALDYEHATRLTRERRPLTGNSVQIIATRPWRLRSAWAAGGAGGYGLEGPLLTRPIAAGAAVGAEESPPFTAPQLCPLQEARDAVEGRGRRNGAPSR